MEHKKSKKIFGVKILQEKIEYLVGEVMHKSATLSEIKEELKELRNTLDIYLDQEGHNKCWVREIWLRERLKRKDGSPYPDPEKVSLAEFLWGCKIFAPEQFPALTPKEEKMMKKIEKAIKECLHD